MMMSNDLLQVDRDSQSLSVFDNNRKRHEDGNEGIRRDMQAEQMKEYATARPAEHMKEHAKACSLNYRNCVQRLVRCRCGDPQVTIERNVGLFYETFDTTGRLTQLHNV